MPALGPLLLTVAGLLAAPFSGCTCDAGGEAVPPAASASAAVIDEGVVRVLVDGAPLSSIPRSEVAGRRPLESFLGTATAPRAEWRELSARAGPRFVSLQPLQRLYPEHQLAFYRDAQGRVCFGAFRPEKPDMPPWMKEKLAAPAVHLVGVEVIELRTKERDVAAALSTIELVRGGATPVTLDESKLATLAKTKPLPGEEGGARKKGWHLRDIVGLAVNGREMSQIAEVVVRAGDAERRISGDELRGGDVVPVIKRNRRGVLKLFVYRRGAAADELSGVHQIAVLKPSELRPKPAVSPSAAPPPAASPHP